MRTEDTLPVRLADYHPSLYAIERVHLTFDLDPSATKVVSRLDIRPRAGTPAGSPLRLDGDDLRFEGVTLDGRPLDAADYRVGPDHFELLAPPSTPFRLEIRTEVNPTANTRLMGLYRSSRTYCTQCEAEGFRRITYFLDRPDVLSVYVVHIIADRADCPVLLANGNPVESGRLDDRRHFAIWSDPWPKPAYLFALVAGDLAVVKDHFRTRSGREVDLGIYVEHGNSARAHYAMDALKRAMRWDEEVFGREYDLDVFNIVAVSDFNMGAMENKGLNIFNDKYVLADETVATDQDYAGIEAVIAHEYFHNWTGNRITCRDWFQLCLKEGLTVFRDQEFSSDMRSRPVERIADVRALRVSQFEEDAGPLAHPVRPEVYKEINNFYTSTVYEKGAEVIRLLKTLIGEKAFAAGMDLYFTRHDGEATTIETFVACFAEASGRDLAQFMLWYRQAGTPVIQVSEDYDAGKARYTLAFEQRHLPSPGQPAKAPMVIPVRFGLVGGDGADLVPSKISGAEIVGDVIVLSEKQHSIVFEGVGERPRASLLRGFSAPVKLSFNLTDGDLIHLMRHDRDQFNRWQAATSLGLRQLMAMTESLASARMPTLMTAYLDALAEIAGDESLDPAFRALVLTPPSENDVARETGQNIDPDAISAAVKALRQAIGRDLQPVLADLARRFTVAGGYSPDAASSGRRSLVNVAMSLRAASGEASVAAEVAARYHGATNMTDRMAALTTLVHGDAADADQALADYYQRFRQVPLALDKWFAVQATRPGAATLDHVKALTADPAFAFHNPNRVRALITTFAMSNPTGFARRDGLGFTFIAETVMKLDESNPQVAARLLGAFRSWRSYEPVRRQAAQEALETVAGKAGLSRDVLDIVERTLA